MVKEVLVRNGQRVEVGNVVLSIVAGPRGPRGFELIAFLPGSERPRLRAHQPLRISLPGYRGVYLESEVRAIERGARRQGGRARGSCATGSATACRCTGAVVVVEGRLTSSTFEADGETFQLHDGMLGTGRGPAEVATRCSRPSSRGCI